jgi:hypothetical protein
MLNEQSGGIYNGNYPIPPDILKGVYTLKCEAVSRTEEAAGGNMTSIDIGSGLAIDIISPQPSGGVVVIDRDSPLELVLSLKSANGSALPGANMSVRIGNQTVILSPMERQGYYTATFTPEDQNATFMTLSAQHGSMEDIRAFDIIITAGGVSASFNPLAFLPFFLVGGILLLMGLLKLLSGRRAAPQPQVIERVTQPRVVERVREVVVREVPKKADPEEERRSRVRQLKAELKNTEKAKDLAEEQYYSRQIDDKTFSKLMQSYEEKIIAIKAELRNLTET